MYNLEFQSGKNSVKIDKDFCVKDEENNLRGCFAILDYKNLKNL